MVQPGHLGCWEYLALLRYYCGCVYLSRVPNQAPTSPTANFSFVCTRSRRICQHHQQRHQTSRNQCSHAQPLHIPSVSSSTLWLVLHLCPLPCLVVAWLFRGTGLGLHTEPKMTHSHASNPFKLSRTWHLHLNFFPVLTTTSEHNVAWISSCIPVRSAVTRFLADDT